MMRSLTDVRTEVHLNGDARAYHADASIGLQAPLWLCSSQSSISIDFVLLFDG